MAIKIPRRATADVGLSTESPLATADLSIPRDRTGEGLQQAGQAISRGASALAGMAEAEQKRTQEDELHAAVIADADSYAGFINDRAADPNFKADGDEYDKWNKGNKTALLEGFTDVGAREKFSKYLDNQNINRTVAVTESQRGRQKQSIIAARDETLEGFARNGLEDVGKDYIQGLQEAGWISGSQKNQWDAILDSAVNEQQKTIASQIINDEILTIAIEAEAVEEGSGWDATLKALNDPKNAKRLADELGMSLADIDDVIEDVKTQATLTRADQVKQTEESQAEEINSIAGKLNNKEYAGIEDFINAQPSMTEIQKGVWLEKAEKSAEAINKRNPDPLTVTNSQVYFDTLKDIESMTPDKIDALTGKGLSLADNEKFKGMLGEDSALNKPTSKRAQAAVARIRALDIRIATQEAKSGEEVVAATEVEADYLRIQNDIDDWIELNKDDKDFDAKLEKKTKELLTPIAEEVTLGFFSGLLRKPERKGAFIAGRPGSQFFGLVSSEEEALATKKFETFQTEAIFETLTPEEQEEARTAFANGWTIKDVTLELRK